MPVRRAVVARNLALAFPELPARRRRRIAAACFRHVATTVLELLWLDRRRLGEIGDVVAVEGLENYEAVRRSGRGTIAVTAHLGNWDLLACAQAHAGVPLHVVTKELSSRGISALWMERRRAAGVALLPSRGSLPGILRALRRGEVVGLVVDQRASGSEAALEVPFFGRSAATTTAPAVLAARTGAAIVPVYSTRLPGGRHLVRIQPEIRPLGTVEATTAAISRRVEGWIRFRPEQWLWLHRRWGEPETFAELHDRG